MASLSIGARKDLTDRQWRILEPLLPRGKRPGRPPKWTRRQLLDGIRWRTRVGAPWRDVPERYGHWQSIYGLFRRWQRAQVWPLIVAKLQAFADAAGLICWTVSVDSTINRAHQHAAGARHDPDTQVEPPGPEPADHALGRSRGGWTTELHLACEQGRKPLSLVLTAGHRGDSPHFMAVLDGIRVARCGPGRPRTRPDRVLADKTSHALNLSSGGRRGGRFGLAGYGEGDVLVVGRSGGQAVMQDADHAVEQVALGGGRAVAGGLASVVVGAGAG